MLLLWGLKGGGGAATLSELVALYNLDVPLHASNNSFDMNSKTLIRLVWGDLQHRCLILSCFN